MSIFLQDLLNPSFHVDAPAANIKGLREAASRGELQPFVITDKITELCDKMLDDKSVHPRMLELAQPLAEEMWLEFGILAINTRNESDRVETILGLYIDRESFISAFLLRHGGNSAFMLQHDNPTAGTATGNLQRFKSVPQRCGMIHSLLVSTLAVLNIPGATEQTPVTHDAKLQKARAKRGKLPLIEYRQVKIAIEREHHAHGAGNHEPAFHKRRHHVIGHIRLRHASEPMGEWGWVKPHWRGDAGLGVILKERTAIARERESTA